MTYVIHILQIKLWEWEAVKDRWDIEIYKNGPSEEVCKFYNVAHERVEEIKTAIEQLNKQSKEEQQ